MLMLALVGLGFGVAALVTTDPQRRLRALRDPRLVARAEARARELVARGWALAPDAVADEPTLRRLRRAAPGCEALTLVIGAVPRGEWCRVELTADIGVPAGVTVTPAVRVDRDGEYPLTPQIVQRGGHGFVVRPEEALARLPARLVTSLATWPNGQVLIIDGAAIRVRADVASAEEIEAVVADALARLVG